MGESVKNTVSIFLPANSFRRKLAKKILQLLHIRNYVVYSYYNTWVYQHSELPVLQPEDSELTLGPLISVVVPVFNTRPNYLLDMVYSVVSQSYKNWELILVNASNSKNSIDQVNQMPQIDTRINVIETKNLGISDNTNKGISAAKGEYIAFLDHDDILDPFALYEVAIAIRSQREELIYSDEDKISENGQIYFDPHFKPDWSPDLMTHVNYINHLTVIKKTLIDRVGLLDPTKDGAQDYDLLLRIIDTHPVIIHVPKVLYHWRAAHNSTAYNFNSKSNITNAGTTALQQHFKNKNLNENAVRFIEKRIDLVFYEVQFKPYEEISIVVTPFASDALLRLFIETLLKRTSTLANKIELLLPIGVAPRFKKKNVTVKTLPTDEQFFINAINNAIFKHVILINQISLPNNPEWLNQLSGYLHLEHVGVLSPVILDNNLIEDCGLAYGFSLNELIYLFRGQVFENNQTFFGNTDWVRDVDALSGRFVLARKNELLDYLKTVEPSSDFLKLSRDFTIYQRRQNKFNVIFSPVTFNNYSINITCRLYRKTTQFFNPNLYDLTTECRLYTPEPTAIKILLNINEKGNR